MPRPRNFCRRRVIHRWLRGASTRSPRHRMNNSGNRMRTVRESFPSYGSSPHMASHSDFFFDRPAVRQSRTTWRYSQAAAVRSAPLGSSVRAHQPTGVGRHLLPEFPVVPLVFSPFQTRPTWAYPVHYTLALASSVILLLHPLTRLTVRSARLRRAEACSFSMFCKVHGMI